MSEGTLTGQSEIYAESWEAARDRVTAAAENIYDSLLDDEFFIDLTDFSAEFLDTIKRLMNLDYENIILISHEDRSKDVTSKNGDKFTSISPNLSEKVSNKIAGMVDLIGRTLEENGRYTISFKTNEVVFGGSRLKLNVKEIPSEYSEIVKLYEAENDSTKVENTTPVEKTTEVVSSVADPAEGLEEAPRRKRREV